MPLFAIHYDIAHPSDRRWVYVHAPHQTPFSDEDLVAIAQANDHRIAYGRLRALNPDALCLDQLWVETSASGIELIPDLIAFLFQLAQPQCKAIYGLPTEYLRHDGSALPTTRLYRQGQFQLAAEHLTQILKSTTDAALCLLLARCYLLLGAPEQALDAIMRALYGRTDWPDAWLALADWEAIYGEMASCVDGYRQAATLTPLSIQAHVNLEYALRTLGRFTEAALETEWQLQRLPIDRNYYSHGWLLPRWHGEALCGGRLLVHWVDGYGDIILNARYLPLAATRAGHIGVETPPALLRLFQASFPSIPFFPTGSEYPSGYHSHTSMIALPAFFGDEAPPLPPYLTISPGRTLPVTEDGRPRIGVNRHASHYSPSRSFPADCLPYLVDMHLGHLTNLRPFPGDAERAVLQRLGIMDAGGRMRDFFDAARHLRAQDLVISVDTALAHLAAAMGKPTVLLLNEPAAPMWRNRVSMQRIYPTLIILSKPAGQSWADFLPRQTTLLRALVERLRAQSVQPSPTPESLLW